MTFRIRSDQRNLCTDGQIFPKPTCLTPVFVLRLTRVSPYPVLVVQRSSVVRTDVKRSRATYSTSTLVCWSVLRVLTPNTLKPSPKVK